MAYSTTQIMIRRLATTNSTLTLFLSFSLLICIFFFLPRTQNLTHQSQTFPQSQDQQFLETLKGLKVILNPNGTLTRPRKFYPSVPATGANSSARVLSRDVTINHLKRTWARVFIPRRNIAGKSPPAKIPIVLFVHGGGFIVFSAGFPSFHHHCNDMAVRLGAMVISVEYRLAPEHRLPAAYDDVLETLMWVRDRKDEWVRRYGDMSRCVVTGESAGGNIVYHVGLRAANQSNNLKPLIIKGLVLSQPFFGGLEKTGSEIRLKNDWTLPLALNEVMWNLSLPVGTDQSHEYCDPSVGGGSPLLDQVRDKGMRVAVLASGEDPLYDREVELAKLLEKRGVRVRSLFSDSGMHGCFTADNTKRRVMLNVVRDFFK